MSKAISVGLVVVMCSGSAASAVDWSGPYAGVSVGNVFAGEFYNPEAEAGTTSFDELEGLMTGVQAGYLLQSDSLVYGIEGDIFIGDAHHEVDDIPTDGESITTGMDWLSTGRARLGFSIGDLLPYATAGFAIGGGSVSTTAGDQEETEQTHVGFAVGGGLEFAVTDRVSVRAEYLYTDLQPIGYLFSDVTQDAGIETHALRAGLNYGF